ncbi:unnamed protein product, partial [marine sediment metagenome]
QTEYNPAHVVIADVDNDGDNDILASHNDGSGGLSVLLWNGAILSLLTKTDSDISFPAVSLA